VYSTGVLLWELLSCKRLFQGEGEVVQALLQNKRPASIATHRPDLPTPLSAAVDRALEPDPEVRFKSAGEFARALSDVLRTVPERTDRARLAREMRNALVYWRKSAAGQKALQERAIAPTQELLPQRLAEKHAAPAATSNKAPPPAEPSKIFLDLSLGSIPIPGGSATVPPTIDPKPEELSASALEIDLDTAVPLVETVSFDPSDASITFELASIKKKPDGTG
jgi:serine/threonine-protein kinase